MTSREKLDDHESLLATLPATHRQRLSAIVIATVLFVAIGVVAPFASTPIRQLSAFVPAVEGATFVTDLITSVLLFAQFSIYRSRALLIIASGYLFAAMMVIPHALFFPETLSAAGVLDSGLQDTAWLFVSWQGGFSLALLVYAWLKDEKRANVPQMFAAIVWSVSIVIGLVCAITWVAMVGDELLPRFYLDKTHIALLFRYVVTSVLLICAFALVLLWTRRRSVLDQWLMVVSCAVLGQQAFAGLLGATRFSVGFYAGRTFSLVASGILLVVLVSEMTGLYARVARSNALLRRERNNKLMNLEAMARSITHQVRQPLAAITMNGEAAMEFLRQSPPDIEEINSAQRAIVDDSHRANEILNSMRALFGRTGARNQVVDMNEIVLRVLRTLESDLKHGGIINRPELASKLPPVVGHEGQLQEVVFNLVQNAIEAMTNTTDRPRVLRIKTEQHGGNEIAVSLLDSGPGINRDQIESIFEAFFTTKKDGMGLGLAICRMIIEGHEGELSASCGINGGALFRFSLPIKANM